ncbi:F-box protein pof6 [Cyphellophora attinorum]|uniref:F-box protein pof6 n=1 Tax=Cyphellophora attinorum TaxID=1664694 RepID=A0A0N1HHQ5_9EURO|nr:F-box protein pof6 [Phialophora attinorum]KPI45617.1 F-box protein pof6 [Phialophora attinorum]
MSRARQSKGAGGATTARRNPLASLRMADMVISKPYLPLEIIAMIVDHLSGPDMIRFARVSRRMLEMIYDDTRWIARLRSMDCWNELAARQKTGDSVRGIQTPQPRRTSTIDQTLVNGKGRPRIDITGDGFDEVEVASPIPQTPGAVLELDPRTALAVFDRVRSVRGRARHEYGKIYRALGRFYIDALKVERPMNASIFKTYTLPEEQATILSHIRRFANSDFSPGGAQRDDKILEIVKVFDTAALLEFRQGYEYRDIQGQMRQYAHVIHILNGGSSAIDLFLDDNRMIQKRSELGSASDCIDYSQGWGQLSLERVNAYFERLAAAFAEEAAVVRTVFPNPERVLLHLLDRTGQQILSPFLSDLFEDARGRSTAVYLRTISGTFAATRQLIAECGVSSDSSDEAQIRANAVIAQIYGPHLESYLEEELQAFRKKADQEVETWSRALRDQAESTESFLMSNVNRQADKKDFMTSFKKVVMMPVALLPSFSTATEKKTAAKTLVNGDLPSRTSTPNPLSQHRSATPSLPAEAPTTELAAKAALMNSRLDNIKSLFSIEVALNLVHAAKSSLERIAQFIALGDIHGDRSRTTCSAIFRSLLHAIGDQHVKPGFDTAIDHLSHFQSRNPATTASSPNGTNNTPTSTSQQVAPLTTFLELVNVGDLIQQMISVFFESELVRLRVVKRDDYLDANVKSKKQFEAMLDERVASGLGKGIDVLIEEVEYICATTQSPTDFNPPDNICIDVGPTTTATRVIEIVGGHTAMLHGATEKTLLDVFVGEVGLRLFAALCKHIKRQRISTSGAIPLISDMSLYAKYIATFRNPDLNNYFIALREVAQIYLIGGEKERDIKEMAGVISDSERFRGIFGVEEVVEFVERRADWLLLASTNKHDSEPDDTYEALVEDVRSDYDELMLQHERDANKQKRHKLEDLHAQVASLTLERNEALRQSHQLEDLAAQVSSLAQERDEILRRQRRDQFALVLIDGDDVLFNDSYISDGMTGGARAAKDLYAAIVRHLKPRGDYEHDYKIQLRIFLNLAGLAGTYTNAQIIPDSSVFGKFVQGFNRKELFEVVDAGNVKEAADIKVRETFNLFRRNVHCTEIILGFSGDNSYANFLHNILPTDPNGFHLSLLRGREFAKALRPLSEQVDVIAFPEIFRVTALDVRKSRSRRGQTPQTSETKRMVPEPQPETIPMQDPHDTDALFDAVIKVAIGAEAAAVKETEPEPMREASPEPKPNVSFPYLSSLFAPGCEVVVAPKAPAPGLQAHAATPKTWASMLGGSGPAVSVLPVQAAAPSRPRSQEPIPPIRSPARRSITPSKNEAVYYVNARGQRLDIDIEDVEDDLLELMGNREGMRAVLGTPSYERKSTRSSADTGRLPTKPATDGLSVLATYQPSKTLGPDPVFYINAFDQRIDVDIEDVDDELLETTSQLGLCLRHYLEWCYEPLREGSCSIGWHGDSELFATGNGKGALRSLARLTPCPFGTACRKEDCIWGHECRGDPCKKQHCAFGKKMHNVSRQGLRAARLQNGPGIGFDVIPATQNFEGRQLSGISQVSVEARNLHKERHMQQAGSDSVKSKPKKEKKNSEWIKALNESRRMATG